MSRALATTLSACLCLPLFAQNTGISLTNGVDGYLEVANSPQLVPQTGITFEAWITYDDATLGSGWRWPTLCRQNIAPGQESYFLRVGAANTNTKSLTWKVVRTNGTAVVCNWTFAAGQLSTWTHVAGTYDGTTARLVVNGVQVASTTGTALPIWDRGGTLRIGKGDDTGGPIEVWNGQIDEVRLWPFGRSVAEIAQTMNYQLGSVPGLVSTWNLDNHTLDTSSNQHATLVGTAPYTSNPLVLNALPVASGFPVGASTPGCLGPLQATFGSLPQPGNLDFAAVCTRSPANAGCLFAVAFGTLPVAFPVAGIDYWLDPNTSVLAFTTANAFGVVRQPLGLPAWLTPGFTMSYQFGFIDPCGPQGITASGALTVLAQ